MKTPIGTLATIFLPALIGLTVALFAGDADQYLLAQLLLLGLFAAAFDLAYGVSGIFSVGHAAFFGGGAYTFGILTLTAGVGTFPALAASILIAGLLALIFGLLASRTTGLYFALATLALGQLVNILIEVKLRDITGGTDGLPGVPRPELLGIDFYANDNFLIFVSAVFVLGMSILATLRASPYGQVLKALNANPVRTNQLGFDVHRYRLSALVVSGMFSGLAGALFGSLTMFVGPEMTHWSMSGDVLIMTVLGGAGTLAGPLLGVAVFEITKEVISQYTQYWYGVLGALFIVVTLTMPRGLLGLLSRRARS